MVGEVKQAGRSEWGTMACAADLRGSRAVRCSTFTTPLTLSPLHVSTPYTSDLMHPVNHLLFAGPFSGNLCVHPRFLCTPGEPPATTATCRGGDPTSSYPGCKSQILRAQGPQQRGRGCRWVSGVRSRGGRAECRGLRVGRRGEGAAGGCRGSEAGVKEPNAEGSGSAEEGRGLQVGVGGQKQG